jgi:nitrate reductase gamma subunit
MVRLLEIGLLGRKPEYAAARGSAWKGGLRTLFSRFIPDYGTWQQSALIIAVGYVFHIGFFIVLFMFAPHILIFQDLLGITWPALPTQIVDATTLLTILALMILLLHRIYNRVRWFLSRPEDYLVWIVTMLPLVTGYLAFHRVGLAPQTLLLLHILSVEILLVVFPFTNLMHAFTSFFARYYTGAIAGHRGAQS